MGAEGKSGWAIGKTLRIKPSTVYAVLSGYSWKHVT
jgi:DNA-binding CsgD family transcriptional regulator